MVRSMDFNTSDPSSNPDKCFFFCFFFFVVVVLFFFFFFFFFFLTSYHIVLFAFLAHLNRKLTRWAYSIVVELSSLRAFTLSNTNFPQVVNQWQTNFI